ncbi:MAG: hypothetical protein HMLIMOIP_002639 [Candidatus Nitrosomirales archaeon]|jgi:hypothetical protein
MPEESEIKVSNKFQPSDMLKSLDSLVDETLQICEFNSEEDTAVKDICETIGMMLTQMKTSVKITPSLLGPSTNVKRAVLGQDGQIMLTYSDDQVEYKKLTDYHSSILGEILNDVFLKLKNATTEYRKTLEGRLSVYRSASKKLKKIDQVLKEEQKISTEDIMEATMQSKGGLR